MDTMLGSLQIALGWIKLSHKGKHPVLTHNGLYQGYVSHRTI